MMVRLGSVGFGLAEFGSGPQTEKVQTAKYAKYAKGEAEVHHGGTKSQSRNSVGMLRFVEVC